MSTDIRIKLKPKIPAPSLKGRKKKPFMKNPICWIGCSLGLPVIVHIPCAVLAFIGVGGGVGFICHTATSSQPTTPQSATSVLPAQGAQTWIGNFNGESYDSYKARFEDLNEMPSWPFEMQRFQSLPGIIVDVDKKTLSTFPPSALKSISGTTATYIDFSEIKRNAKNTDANYKIILPGDQDNILHLRTCHSTLIVGIEDTNTDGKLTSYSVEQRSAKPFNLLGQIAVLKQVNQL